MDREFLYIWLQIVVVTITAVVTLALLIGSLIVIKTGYFISGILMFIGGLLMMSVCIAFIIWLE